ncbi:hypothetical protein UlMin_014288 [Ulmus minor]
MDAKANPRVMLIILSLFLYIHICLGADTISANQSLSGDQTLVSAGEKFVLGFFKPGNSSRYYIGMWYDYKVVSQQTIVWVANREISVSDRFSSELRISDGNLVLFNESKVPIWSTNVSSTSPSVQAVLQDDGNLVLNDGSSNSSEPMWQSFDYPTHTLLPGNKIGFNKKTKTHTLLTSWKNSEDPAPGLFSLQLNANESSYIILWNRSKPYWTSGPWDGERFSLIPEMRLNYIFNYSYVSNENESYFTYSVYTSASIISRFIIHSSGQIQQQNWLPTNGWNLFWSQPRQQCEVYALCGTYGSCNEISLPFCTCLTGFQPESRRDWDMGDYSGGCLRKILLQCEDDNLPDSERDKFQEMPGYSLPANQQPVRAGSLQECQSTCLNNCACTAYAYDSLKCLIWTEDLLNLQKLVQGDRNTKTLFIRLAASQFQNSLKNGSSRNPKLYVLLGIVATATVILCVCCFVYYLRRKEVACRRGNNQAIQLYESEKRLTNFLNSSQFRDDETQGIDVPVVVLESIIAATDNFSEVNKLGKGGFGPVYKGKFPGGNEIAIKRLSSGSGQGLEEFHNEVLLIAKLQHRNLVRLLGYCAEGDEKILLYEYMPNKSLDSFIFNQTLCMLLNWEMRFNIILGIARGLVYLHHDSRLRIIHRDLKTSNVLLDEDMNPKISDFGLARIFGGTQTEANTRRVVGTYGYMSPEYALEGFFSIKSDVFSFGVVVLEIISGKRNTGFYRSEEALSLLGYAWKLWEENRALDLMEPTLHENCNENEFLKCFNLGLLCVQEDPNDRPTMPDVVVMLGSETAILPGPKKPAFVLRRSLSSVAACCKPFSVNEITASLEQGR